jgi:predicted nucleic acid-binding protein
VRVTHLPPDTQEQRPDALGADDRGRPLWAERTGMVSTQVLQEFYAVVTRKLARPMARSQAREIIETYSAWPVVIVNPDLILVATRLEESHQLSFWDALIVESARISGATRLLTEDMRTGRVIEGIRIENPFRGHAEQQLDSRQTHDA